MRQLKSDKSQSSSVGETVQSPDKSGSDVTPTIHHRLQKESNENALVEKMSIPEISPEEHDTFEDEPDICQEVPKHRAESNGGKLSSFLSRNVGSLSRDILVQGDSGSVVSELTFDHALRPMAHHQVLSTLAARRIHEEVVSCESGESSFTPRTRGNATASEENSSDLYYNAFQVSMGEDNLPPLHERAHDTDDASESGLHQPTVTPSPHSSFRNLYDRGNSGRAMSSRSMESTEESLQYSEQESNLNDDQSFSVFSLSTYGHSVVSRSLRPTRVETVVEETTQHDDSGGDFDIEAEAATTHAATHATSYATAQRSDLRRSQTSGTDESYEFSEREAMDFSERGATYVSSATESYVSTSYMSASTAGYSVRSAKPRWTSAFHYPSADASIGSESNATNRASNIASEDSVDLASLEAEEPYPQIANAISSETTPNLAVTTTVTTVQINGQSIQTTNYANPEIGSPRSAPQAYSEMEDTSEIEDHSEAEEMSLSRETTLLIDLDSLAGPGESANAAASSTVTIGDIIVHQDPSTDGSPLQAIKHGLSTDASFQQVVTKDYLSDPEKAEPACEDVAPLFDIDDTCANVTTIGQSIGDNSIEERTAKEVEPGKRLTNEECSATEDDPTGQPPVHFAKPLKDEQRCQDEVTKEEPSQLKKGDWCPQELQDNVSQESSTVDVERPTEMKDNQKKEMIEKAARRGCARKWVWICIGLALALAVLAVPAVVIPLVVIHARKGGRRNLRGMLRPSKGAPIPTVVEAPGPRLEMVPTSNENGLSR